MLLFTIAAPFAEIYALHWAWRNRGRPGWGVAFSKIGAIYSGLVIAGMGLYIIMTPHANVSTETAYIARFGRSLLLASMASSFFVLLGEDRRIKIAIALVALGGASLAAFTYLSY